MTRCKRSVAEETCDQSVERDAARAEGHDGERHRRRLPGRPVQNSSKADRQSKQRLRSATSNNIIAGAVPHLADGREICHLVRNRTGLLSNWQPQRDGLPAQLQEGNRNRCRGLPGVGCTRLTPRGRQSMIQCDGRGPGWRSLCDRSGETRAARSERRACPGWWNGTERL